MFNQMGTIVLKAFNLAAFLNECSGCHGVYQLQHVVLNKTKLHVTVGCLHPTREAMTCAFINNSQVNILEAACFGRRSV